MKRRAREGKGGAGGKVIDIIDIVDGLPSAIGGLVEGADPREERQR